MSFRCSRKQALRERTCLKQSSSMTLSWLVESFDLECSNLSARTNTGSSSIPVVILKWDIRVYDKSRQLICGWALKNVNGFQNCAIIWSYVLYVLLIFFGGGVDEWVHSMAELRSKKCVMSDVCYLGSTWRRKNVDSRRWMSLRLAMFLKPNWFLLLGGSNLYL
jgi:hypothetical protein